MFILSVTMFILGIASFLDTVFSYGSMFRTGFSAMLMLLAIWTFTRARATGDLWKIETEPKLNPSPESQETQSNQPSEAKQKKLEPVG
ncbi:MAG: hypothetical protein GY839_01415 [candidate division Zixibacteria bacterium]|nr:hypothetical protein [candidate division Zixibacteria bacterium]